MNMNLKLKKTKKLQKQVIDALRVVIASAGALHYAAYENLQPIANELKSIDSRQRAPFMMDLKKDIERIIQIADKLNARMKNRHVLPQVADHFENISFGIFQCIAPLAVMPESEIYQEAMRLSDATPRYAILSEQVKFFDAVLEKARQSNHDALKMVKERKDVLEALNAQPILIEDNGRIKVYDIAPEREEVEEET